MSSSRNHQIFFCISFDCDWGGNDECDEAFEDIHAAIEEGELRGEISFHNGDESEFRAVRKEQKKRSA